MGNRSAGLNGVLYSTREGISNGCLTIHGMDIERADLDTQVYEGLVRCEDHIEGIAWTEDWIARPDASLVHKILERRYGFQVEPKEVNLLTKGHDFTLLGSFNRALEHYILQGILTHNPDLPRLYWVEQAEDK